MLFAITSGKSQYLYSERFYQYSDDNVCPKISKIKNKNLCNNRSANYENKDNGKIRFLSYFVRSNEPIIIKAEKVEIFNQRGFMNILMTVYVKK